MGNFVVDGTVLPGPKVEWDGVSLQVAHPEMFVAPTEFNVYRDAINDLRSMATVYDARGYLHLDGVTDDAVALNALMASVAPTLGQGAPYGVVIRFPPGAKVLCATTMLVVPNGVWLEGDRGNCTMIFPGPAFNQPALIQNALQTGTGEFFGLKNLYLWGAKTTGAVCSDAVLQVIGGFINSVIDGVIVVDASNNGMHLGAKGTPGGAGPLLVDNCWVATPSGHGIVIDEDVTNTGEVTGMWLRHVASENQGSNHSAVYLHGQGGGRCGGWKIDNLHVEMGGVGAGGVALTIDNVSDVKVSTMQVLGNAANGQTGIVITNQAQNLRIQIESLTNINGITAISDLKNGVTFGAVNVPVYWTSDIVWPRLTLSPINGKSLAVVDSTGQVRAWYDANGRLTGAGPFGAALEMLANPQGTPGASDDRAWMVMDHAGANPFGFYYPNGGGGAVRERMYTSGADVRQVATDGSVFNYTNITNQNPVTNQSAVTNQSSLSVAKALGLSNELAMAIAASPGDLAPAGIADAFMLLLTPSAASAPTGIAAPTTVTGKVMLVYNDSATLTITFANNAGGVAANGVIGKGGAGMTLGPKLGAWVYYSPSKARWVEISL